VGVEIVRKALLTGQTYDSRSEEVKPYKRQYYEENKKEIKAYYQRYYEANKEKILAHNRAYRAKKRAEREGGARGTGD
jgi:hypothetical protein